MASQASHMGSCTAGGQAFTLARSVVFVGFMGAGKTSIARRIARNTRLVSIDADTYFTHSVGVSAGTFIREYGEPAFRAQETAVLRELLDRDPAFISCGGGVVERQVNRELLSGQFVVFLDISADDARARITNLGSRPLFGDMEHARALEEHRRPLYEEVADVTVAVAGRSIAALADEVESLLEERGILCRQPR